MKKYPQRKILPHQVPSWVSSGNLFFITICGNPPHKNQFCLSNIGKRLLESAQFYHDQLKWWLRLILLMPDHIHGLIAFPREQAIKQVVYAWKSYNAKYLGIKWQRDFFDHRLRNDENVQQKVLYIRNNPVRVGLIDGYKKWPYVLENW